MFQLPSSGMTFFTWSGPHRRHGASRLSSTVQLTRRRRLGLAFAATLILTFAAGAFSAFSQESPAPPPAPAIEQPATTAPAETIAPEAGPAGPETNMPARSPQDSALPHDLSPWGMFMAADWVVKAVMIGLAIASVITWTVWIAKSLELSRARRKAARAMTKLLATRSLDEAAGALDYKSGIAGHLVHAAHQEVAATAGMRTEPAGVKERVSSHLSRIEARAGRSMSKGTGVLATIGSTAPFVGLFGTVWGIMNSFIGISEAQTTNLAIVAPGIAEALLATALGLVAAIPAVVIYNVFARSIAGYRNELADASAVIERLVSRDLDMGGAGRGARLPHAAE